MQYVRDISRLGAAALAISGFVVCALGPAAAPAQTPAASAPAVVYAFTYTPAPATGTPRIISVELNSNTLHAGGPIDIRVKTTPDVTKVTSGNGRHKGDLTAMGGGLFTADSKLPHVGGLLNVAIKLHIEATTADGKSTSVDVPVRYH